MKRSFCLVVCLMLAAAMVLSFAACNKTDTPDTTTTVQQQGTTTVPDDGTTTEKPDDGTTVPDDGTTTEKPEDTTTGPDDGTTTEKPKDTEAPVLNVDGIQERVLSETITVTGSVSDDTAVAFVTVGGVEATVTDQSFSVNITLKPGENILEVMATDTSGNRSESKTVKVTYVKYLNNLMANDDVLTVYNGPAFSAGHQDGFVFIYNGEIYLLDGGMTDTTPGSIYNYLLNLRNKILSEATIEEAKDMKLCLNLIISHFHYDHVQALMTQIIPCEDFEISSIYYGKQSVYDLGSDSDKREAIINGARTANAEKHEVDFGKTETFSVGDMTIKLYGASEDWGADHASKIRSIYYPSKGQTYDCHDAVENSNSMWMKLTFGGKSMLFTGDIMKKLHESYVKVGDYNGIGGEAFDEMIAYYGAAEFDVDILKFPHHGNERADAMYAVCEVMSPDLIIFTSLYNEYLPVMQTIPGKIMYNGSYASAALDGMTFTLTSSGQLDAIRAGKTEHVYGSQGEYLGILGELFEERSVSVTPSASLAGKGTESEPYLIGSREDLAYFAENYYTLCGDNGAHFKLTADIVWSDYKSGLLPLSNWTPIGSPAIGMKPFIGTFDGDGHSISGIYCAGCKESEMIFNATAYYQLGSVSAMFGAVEGTVKNLIIKDSSFLGNRMVGSIVAHVAPGGNTNIINCASFALVQGFEGVGGIFGGYFNRASYGPVHDDVDANGTVFIDKCVNFGPVNSVSTNANTSVGGIAGSFREMKKATVTECANYADIVSSGGCVGGIVGQAVYCELTMKNCVNGGIILGRYLTGGIIGKIQNEDEYPKTVECLVNYGNVGSTEDGRVGFINGSAAGAKYQDCFNGKSCYYLSTAVLVPAAGTSVVTNGTAYAGYYTAVDAAELSALGASLNLSADIWAGSSNVTGLGLGLPTIKTITIVQLY